MSAGAVITIISVYLTQVTFNPTAFAHVDSTYALDGLGRYHLVGRGSPRFSIDGHAPALGAVAIAGAVAVVITAAVAVLPNRRILVSAVNAGVACLTAGVIAAAVACDAMQGTSFPEHTWAAGFWLLAVGASLTVSAALMNAARVGLDTRSDQRATQHWTSE
jgi:hypothetical protein